MQPADRDGTAPAVPSAAAAAAAPRELNDGCDAIRSCCSNALRPAREVSTESAAGSVAAAVAAATTCCLTSSCCRTFCMSACSRWASAVTGAAASDGPGSLQVNCCRSPADVAGADPAAAAAARMLALPAAWLFFGGAAVVPAALLTCCASSASSCSFLSTVAASAALPAAEGAAVGVAADGSVAAAGRSSPSSSAAGVFAAASSWVGRSRVSSSVAATAAGAAGSSPVAAADVVVVVAAAAASAARPAAEAATAGSRPAAATLPLLRVKDPVSRAANSRSSSASAATASSPSDPSAAAPSSSCSMQLSPATLRTCSSERWALASAAAVGLSGACDAGGILAAGAPSMPGSCPAAAAVAPTLLSRAAVAALVATGRAARNFDSSASSCCRLWRRLSTPWPGGVVAVVPPPGCLSWSVPSCWTRWVCSGEQAGCCCCCCWRLKMWTLMLQLLSDAQLRPDLWCCKPAAFLALTWDSVAVAAAMAAACSMFYG